MKTIPLMLIAGFGLATVGAAAAPSPAAPKQVVYEVIGERKVTLDIDRPADWAPTDKRPAIVFFFGGGWTSGSPTQFQPQAEYFAQRGLVCLRADYRVRSRDHVRPDACVQDALQAMRWVRGHATELGIDPARIVAAGGSAGGHLAACTFYLASTDEPRGAVSPAPNAMVLYNPVVDLVSVQNASDRAFVAGMSPEEVDRISPARHLRPHAPPTLVLDGTADRFNAQIREFVQKVRALGDPIEAIYTEGQPHGFFNNPPWLGQTTAAVDAFLCRIGYLQAEPKVPLPTHGFKQGARGK